MKYDAAGLSLFEPVAVRIDRDELVVGRVGRDLAPDPVAERHGALDVEELAVDLEQVGPLVRPVVDEIGAADQPVDQGRRA